MNGIANSIVAWLFYGVEYVVLPAMTLWGWVRWLRRPKERTLPSASSLIGFALATVSIVLIVSSVLYARSVGGFPYGDPRLMRIMSCGGVLSLGSAAFAIGGVWGASSLRWFALVCALATLFFWFAAGIAE